MPSDVDPRIAATITGSWPRIGLDFEWRCTGDRRTGLCSRRSRHHATGELYPLQPRRKQKQRPLAMPGVSDSMLTHEQIERRLAMLETMLARAHPKDLPYLSTAIERLLDLQRDLGRKQMQP